MTNLITNSNLSDDTYYTLSDANVDVDNRIVFNQPDGGNLFYFTVTGLTPNVLHKLHYMQEVATGDATEVVGLSGPHHHNECGPVTIEFVPETSSFNFQFRGHGTSGWGWIAAPYLREM